VQWWQVTRSVPWPPVAVLPQQVAKLLREFHFALQTVVVFQGFELGQLGGELLFKCTELCETGHFLLQFRFVRIKADRSRMTILGDFALKTF
jgi:hypothetical protein